MSTRPPRKNLSIQLVKPMADGGLDKHRRLSIAEQEIEEELRRYGNLAAVRDVGELVHLLASYVENLTTVRLTGEEKKALVIKKFRQYNTDYESEIDQKWIGILIDTLVVVGSVVKVPQSRLALKSAASFCSRFF